VAVRGGNIRGHRGGPLPAPATFPQPPRGHRARGVLIYETFATGNERYGRPSNPGFLLKSGELLEIVRGRLEVIAYEALEETDPKPAVLQRICAVNARMV